MVRERVREDSCGVCPSEGSAGAVWATVDAWGGESNARAGVCWQERRRGCRVGAGGCGSQRQRCVGELVEAVLGRVVAQAGS